MEINKQLFEDVLSGKLKGTFVLRNKMDIETNVLIRNVSNSYYVFPYKIYNRTYTENGLMLKSMLSEWDIIDFIPDIDKIEIDPEMHSYNERDIQFIEHFIKGHHMKEKELKIEIPEGFEIDESKSTFEKIVFKKKVLKPRSWEEYERMVLKAMGYKDSVTDTINITFPNLFIKVSDHKFLQEHTAFIKLCLLRKTWIGDWEPNWNDHEQWKATILSENSSFVVADFCDLLSRPLSFPTKEMANDFMNCFKDLLEIAKPLI